MFKLRLDLSSFGSHWQINLKNAVQEHHSEIFVGNNCFKLIIKHPLHKLIEWKLLPVELSQSFQSFCVEHPLGNT